MKPDTLLEQWDEFVSRRALPYYLDSHQLMMRQVLNRFPVGKLGDLSDVDLAETVHSESQRSFSFFLNHFQKFLTIHDLDRQLR